MKTLVIAEKPSAARDLEKGLRKYGHFKKNELYFESEKFIIAWARGHLLKIKQPKEYNNFQGWKLEGLPWEPPNGFEYVLPQDAGVKKLFEQIKKLMNRNDVNLVINACDAGREGENIFWAIYESSNCRLPVKRFFESASLTPKTIQYIIENDLKGEDFFIPRKNAAKARQHADYLIGMNFTIGLTAKSREKMIAGRVKLPVLKLLKDRKDEIEKFKPQPYYEIEIEFDGYKGKWFKEKETKIFDLNIAKQLEQKLQNETIGTVIDKKTDIVYENPPKLFNLTRLQQEANKRFGFDLSKTLQIAQSLYETHKLTTYPRTDSEVLGTAHIHKLEPMLKTIGKINEYNEYVDEIFNFGIKTNKHFIDDSKLTDHHAIVPNDDVEPDLSKLSPDELKIYDLIVRRFLAVFYPKAEYEKTEIFTEVSGETFKTVGRIELNKAWKKIMNKNNSEEDELLPSVNKDDVVNVNKVLLHEKTTKPPKHYTYATLVGIMEDPRKFIEEKELKQALKESETGGLGTSATRAGIIKELIDHGYIISKNKQLIISDTGEALLLIAPEELKSVRITAEWEQKLKLIEQNKFDYESFMLEIRKFIFDNIQALKETDISKEFNKLTSIGDCPNCNKNIIESKRAYFCESTSKENVCFLFPKKIKEKIISRDQIIKIINTGQTDVIKGFIGKNGKKFNARIQYQNKKLSFSIVNSVEKTTLICPFCNSGNILENSKAFGCTNWKSLGCTFTVWKNGTKINKKVIEQLINEGQTQYISGLKSKYGKTFTAKLVLDKKNKKVVLEKKV